MSSSVTSTMGWLFHLSNGVTFGIMYAVVGARRHWLWGVAVGGDPRDRGVPHAVQGPLRARRPARRRRDRLRRPLPLRLAARQVRATSRQHRSGPAGDVPVPERHRARTRRSSRSSCGSSRGTSPTCGARRAGSPTTPGRPVLLVAVGEAFTPEFARIRPGECVLVVNRTDNGVRDAVRRRARAGRGRLLLPKRRASSG